MQILTSRKRELNLYKLISEIDSRAFIVSYEPKHIQGGFWVKQVKNRGMFNRGEEKVLKDTALTEKVTEKGEIMEEVFENQLSESDLTKQRPQKPNITPKI